MTNMRRATISVPEDIDNFVLELRKKDVRFIRASYSEIVRYLLKSSIAAYEQDVKKEVG